jgi:hypothetical protein
VRADRRLPPAAIRRQHARMRTSLEGLAAEGFEPLVVLSSPDEADAVVIEQISA